MLLKFKPALLPMFTIVLFTPANKPGSSNRSRYLGCLKKLVTLATYSSGLLVLPYDSFIASSKVKSSLPFTVNFLPFKALFTSFCIDVLNTLAAVGF